MFTFHLLYFLFFLMTMDPRPPFEEPSQYPNDIQDEMQISRKPKLAISFDDGNTGDMPGYALDVWDGLILQHLEKYDARVIFFVTGGQVNSPNGRKLLENWVQSGHCLGNQTYTHPNFNSEEVSLEDYKRDFLKNNTFLSTFDNYIPFFRFPYLKEGESLEKRDGFRKFLEENGFRNGHVTIDGSDWYINSRLLSRLKRNPNEKIEDFRDFYINHHLERANFNDSLATVLTERKINHVLLLHHNLATSLFLGDLLEALTAEGWEIIDALEAYEDAVYQKLPNTLPAGGNFLRALSKEAGIYGSLFAHEAEREGYLKNKMDILGL